MATTTVSEYRNVSVSDLVVRNPMRSKLDKDRIATLAADIKAHGLNEPIVVRPLPGDKWDVIAGHRRIEAVKGLGWKEIDAHVRRGLTDVEALAIRLGENIHREDLDPVDKARGIVAFVEAKRKEDPKVTLDAIGKALGISQTEVSHADLLLRQTKPIQEHVRAGRLTPGHIEHVLNALGPILEREKFSPQEIAKAKEDYAAVIVAEGLSILDAKDQRQDFFYGVAGDRRDATAKADAETRKAALAKVLPKAKVPRCPKHPDYDTTRFEERKEGLLLFGLCGDKWWAETGELYHTRAEINEMERERKDRSARSKEARKKAGPAKPVEREYAAFLSLASANEWAEGWTARGTKEGGVRELVLRPNELTVLAKQKPFPGIPEVREALPGGDYSYWAHPIYFDAIDGAGLRGKAGPFRTRIQIGKFRSRPSVQDNVAERKLAKVVRDIRAELLAFQRKVLGVEQDGGDLWPAEVDGFKLGEKVRISDKFGTASHRGKPGTILAFDVETGGGVMERYRYGSDSGEPRVTVHPKGLVAVLNANVTQKVVAPSDLEKATKFACAVCGGAAKVVPVGEGKSPARVCAKCGNAEGKCDLAVCKKKEKGPPKKKAKAAAK